jgi:hypothetical protein
MGKDRQTLVRKNQPFSSKQRLNLDHYIQVEEVKDEQGRVQSRFVRFNLDKNVLDRILRTKAKKQRLDISKNLLSELRSYVLWDGENSRQSGLIFCSYYLEPEVKVSSEEIVLRSVISVDGDIIYQIRQDRLEDYILCLAIATAHHWLISQLLNQLKIETLPRLNWLSWGLALLIVVVVGLIFAKAIIANPLLLLGLVAIAWFLQVILKWLVRLLFPITVLQLLSRLLSRNLRNKQIAKDILKRFIE